MRIDAKIFSDIWRLSGDSQFVTSLLKKISAYSSNDYIKSIKYYIREGVFIFREGEIFFCEGENKLCEGEITAYYMDGIRYE